MSLTTAPGSPTKPKPVQPADLTPRDDLKKQVSEVLKRVDQLIKKGDLQQAQLEVAHAKQLDPKNVYALAFEERIENLMTQDRESQLASEARRRGEEEALRVFQESQRKADEERHHAAPPKASATPTPSLGAATVRRSIPNDDQPSSVEVEAMIRRVAAEELKRRQAITHDDSAAPVSRGSHTEDLRIYREFLQQVWSKGAPTEDEFRQVGLLRTALLVPKEEHSAIERDVRMNAYMIAFQHQAGSANGTQQALLDLRKTYGISEEEHARLAPRLPAAPQAARKRPIVLVIDDDDRLLEILSQVVEDAGFEAIALPTSDEAYALLRKLRPDLILCDINLETSTMGGFTFYERVQERHELQDVPFIFLTGLTDEVLVRTGKELGVDDYLTKPISEATLVSTLRGKMKRFRQLRNVFPKNAAA